MVALFFTLAILEIKTLPKGNGLFGRNVFKNPAR